MKKNFLKTRKGRLTNKAQSIIEYALLIGIITATFLTMQTFGKRGIQAGVKVALDELGYQGNYEKFELNRGVLLSSKAKVETPRNFKVVKTFEKGRTWRGEWVEERSEDPLSNEVVYFQGLEKIKKVK